TSSPIRTTVGSRRISSAIASRTASPKPMSPRTVGAVCVSSINVLIHFVGSRICSRDREFDRRVHFCRQFGADLLEGRCGGQPFFHQPVAEDLDWIAIAHPLLFFRFGTVIRACDVSDMMTVVPVRVQ